MSGIQYVTDDKGHKVGVLIDLKKHGAMWENFWDGLVSESRRKEKAIPLRAIPGQQAEAQPRAWLNTLSKSSSRRKGNWMPCSAA